tara:strand:- start:1594 stop:2979 length:1386 start_codon:yes stop_codon:yes gene_type:complete
MSEIKVNTITPRSGTTLTLGGSGDTVTLAACASQSGFGRTGTVDWCTTAKTSPFTAATGKGYFVNTCGGVVTVTLPASPSAGDIVALKDYKDTWDNNKVTVGRNSSKIFGECLDANLNTEGQTVTLVYVDGTQGWVNTQTDTTVQGNQYIQATGGNAVVTCGNYKTHIFTADGNFVVCSASPTAPNNVVDYLVVAGGGGGGRGGTPAYMGGGGGAGGFRYFSALSPAGSPLVAPAGITVSATTYPITVGAGGAAAPSDNNKGCNGANSVFSTITSAGGGFGAAGGGTPESGGPGGSGGGSTQGQPGGSGNTPPVSPAQGKDGGVGAPGNNNAGGGGGGAACAGSTSPHPNTGGAGGSGSYTPDGFIGPTAPSYGTPGPVSSTRYFAGGGGAVASAPTGTPAGGAGGGGVGGTGGGPGGVAAGAGTTNTGGAGGGGSGCCTSGSGAAGTGGSGIVMIRYRYQ